jgi:hypothetical protein
MRAAERASRCYSAAGRMGRSTATNPAHFVSANIGSFLLLGLIDIGSLDADVNRGSRTNNLRRQSYDG